MSSTPARMPERLRDAVLQTLAARNKATAVRAFVWHSAHELVVRNQTHAATPGAVCRH